MPDTFRRGASPVSTDGISPCRRRIRLPVGAAAIQCAAMPNLMPRIGGTGDFPEHPTERMGARTFCLGVHQVVEIAFRRRCRLRTGTPRQLFRLHRERAPMRLTLVSAGVRAYRSRGRMSAVAASIHRGADGKAIPSALSFCAESAPYASPCRKGVARCGSARYFNPCLHGMPSFGAEPRRRPPCAGVLHFSRSSLPRNPASPPGRAGA